jgi:hypothetical protein
VHPEQGVAGGGVLQAEPGGLDVRAGRQALGQVMRRQVAAVIGPA